MNKVLKIALIAIAAIQLLAFIMTFGQSEAAFGYGTANFLIGVFMLLFGAVFCVFKDTRNMGKALLIASAVVIIIGTAVCSQAPIAFH